MRKFFDTLSFTHLQQILRKRIRDGELLRLIGKWLHAGVMESGRVTRPETGTPQGGVVSPVLANVYLHEVLDEWFAHDVKPRLCGRAFLVRYADDFVIGFEREDDARRVMDVLPKRFGKYGLTTHPTKTRLIPFRRPPRGVRQRRDDSRGLGAFDLLGFTQFWGRSRRGYWVIQKKTAASRLRRFLKAVAVWCRRSRHDPVGEQHAKLTRKLRGHDAYYGVTGSSRMLAEVRYHVRRTWRTWLNRRSQKRHMPWSKFERLLQRYPLPPPRIVHSVMARVAKP